SRCLQFNLKQMSQASIVDHLSQVLAAETIPFELPALRHLAKGAAGSMRDALSLLDQAIAHGAGQVTDESVRAMLGTVGDEYLFALLDGLLAQDIHAMLAVAKQMDAGSFSFDGGLQELATLFHRIALAQFAPEALIDEAERTGLTVYAQALDAEFLQLAYQIAIHGRDELALAPDEYAGFVMTLLRLHAFRPERNVSNAALAAPAKSAPIKTPPPKTSPAAIAQENTRNPVPSAVPQEDLLRGVSPAPTFPVSSTSAPASSGDDWHAQVAKLSLTGMAKQLAQHCELTQLTDTAILLRLSPVHKHLLGTVQQDKLQTELQSHYGRKLRLEIEVAEPASMTPADRSRTAQRERQDRAVAAIEQDPFVREVVDLFDASIDESTIKSVTKE
ncbi:MAG: DNA polymerase III subunit gamma/tau C-terminal domain-containing protein, partial [Rugosibacter sp.]|nr:DNA polymerase III subunit gamma/tau C-terminal domain-containing protein [Rugosibacter sp.]